jgi:hypothetical protein
MGRRNARHISASLGGVLEQAAPKTPLAAIQMAWPQAVGPAIDRVASASWAEQLDLLQNELLGKLNKALGGAPEARGMRFRVAEHGVGKGAP